MGFENNNNFIECNRFFQVSWLKVEEDDIVFVEFPIVEKTINNKKMKVVDWEVNNWEWTARGSEISWKLVDMYSASHETNGVKYNNFNFIFEDKDWYFKVGIIMNKPCRSLINKLAEVTDFDKKMFISVFNSALELTNKEWKNYFKTFKNLVLRQDDWIWNKIKFDWKHSKDEMKELAVVVLKATWEFDKMDYSLLDKLMIEEFELLKERLKEFNKTKAPKSSEQLREEIETEKDFGSEEEITFDDKPKETKPAKKKTKTPAEQQEEDDLPF